MSRGKKILEMLKKCKDESASTFGDREHATFETSNDIISSNSILQSAKAHRKYIDDIPTIPTISSSNHPGENRNEQITELGNYFKSGDERCTRVTSKSQKYGILPNVITKSALHCENKVENCNKSTDQSNVHNIVSSGPFIECITNDNNKKDGHNLTVEPSRFSSEYLGEKNTNSNIKLTEYDELSIDKVIRQDEDKVLPSSVSGDTSTYEYKASDTEDERSYSDDSDYLPEDDSNSTNSDSDYLEMIGNSVKRKPDYGALEKEESSLATASSNTRRLSNLSLEQHTSVMKEDICNLPSKSSVSESTIKVAEFASRYPSTEANESILTRQCSTNSDYSDPKTQRKNKWVRVKRLPDLCYFCETEVLNFGRHLLRSHSHESEVQKIMTFKSKELPRKRLIAAIRKRGNHLRNSSNCVKPVKKSHVPGRDNSECVPCKHCLGYFRPEQLWRHIKSCLQNPGEKTKYSHRTDAQDLFVYHSVDQRLKETVFPTMRPDKISLVAKKDTLICRYGAQYLTSHREKHHINVCSRKMRELAKILMEVQKLHPTIKNLYDALQPIYFDSFVQATKIVSGYDASKEEYHSSTFAMNISTSLKECCSLAIRITLKRKSYNSTVDTAQQEANFSTFQQLLKDSWKFEVSSVAASCLNTKKWNKITIVPLASDLKIFRSYLIEKAETALEKLKNGSYDEQAYKLLIEVTYCRSMLLNRKRGGELQRMSLDIYQNSAKRQSYEEFNDAISPTEKVLLKKFKRVVIRGKRDRGVPVLFSIDVQQHLKLLTSLRDRFVKKGNIYLFPKLKNETPITGYKVMQKHAALSGAKNPGAITSTRLRKHLATMSQILELSPNDIEQLATFMGHTRDIHTQVYRLPDDVYQTAKIAKLLVLMESGKAGKYKGKSLDDIEIDMEEEVIEDDSGGEQIEEESLEQHPPSSVQLTRKFRRRLVPWTTEQKKLTTTYFREHILNKKPPKKEECSYLKQTHPGVFNNKTWPQIKVFVQNIYSKK